MSNLLKISIRRSLAILEIIIAIWLLILFTAGFMHEVDFMLIGALILYVPVFIVVISAARINWKQEVKKSWIIWLAEILIFSFIVLDAFYEYIFRTP